MSMVTIYILFLIALLVWNIVFPEKDDTPDPMKSNPKI